MTPKKIIRIIEALSEYILRKSSLLRPVHLSIRISKRYCDLGLLESSMLDNMREF